MPGKIISGAAIVLFFCLSLFPGCDGNGLHSLEQVSKTRQCRANLNVLCTDQANYRDELGRWAESIEELDKYAGRTRPLTCPETGEPYEVKILEDGYLVSCPCGHGFVETGRRNWTGGGCR